MDKIHLKTVFEMVVPNIVISMAQHDNILNILMFFY